MLCKNNFFIKPCRQSAAGISESFQLASLQQFPPLLVSISLRLTTLNLRQLIRSIFRHTPRHLTLSQQTPLNKTDTYLLQAKEH